MPNQLAADECARELGADQRNGSRASPAWLRGCLLAVILAGLWLRLAYPTCTVFGVDQAEACAFAEGIANGEWPTAGLVNTGGIRNLPGFVYILGAVWTIWPDPLALVYFIAGANVLAVAGAGLLIRRWAGSSTAWWATAFLAAGPWAIQQSQWIWAQNLLFPCAVLTCLFLWLWIVRQRDWAALGLIVSLTLMVHIHMAGFAWWLAIAAIVARCRPRMPVRFLAVGLLIAALSILPYALGRNIALPQGNSFGYRHGWRVLVSAVMSVCGLGWQWTFVDASEQFAAHLHWRRWAYEAASIVPVALLAWGAMLAARGLVTAWRAPRAAHCTARNVFGAAALLVPIAMLLLALRVSPTHLTAWYPLPFALIGCAIAHLEGHFSRWSQRGLHGLLLGALLGQIGFAAEQLIYIRGHDGVPGSRIERTYAGSKADVTRASELVCADEVWMLYEDAAGWREPAAAYLLRHARWPQSTPGRAVVHFHWWLGADNSRVEVERLPPGALPPKGAYKVHPWTGPQQRDGRIPMRP